MKEKEGTLLGSYQQGRCCQQRAVINIDGYSPPPIHVIYKSCSTHNYIYTKHNELQLQRAMSQ